MEIETENNKRLGLRHIRDIISELQEEGLLAHDRAEGLPIDAGTHEGITPEELPIPPEIAEECNQSQRYFDELLEEFHPTEEDEERLSRIIRES